MVRCRVVVENEEGCQRAGGQDLLAEPRKWARIYGVVKLFRVNTCLEERDLLMNERTKKVGEKPKRSCVI